MKIRYLFIAVLFSTLVFGCGSDVEYPVTLTFTALENVGDVKAYELIDGAVVEIDAAAYADDPELDYDNTTIWNSIVLLSATEAQIVTSDTTGTASYIEEDGTFNFAGVEEGQAFTFMGNGNEDEIKVSAQSSRIFGGGLEASISGPCFTINTSNFCNTEDLINPETDDEGTTAVSKKYNLVFKIN